MAYVYVESSVQQERFKHTDDLLREFPNCRPINPDRSVIDSPLVLKDGKRTTLRIQLPPHFPTERPQLSVLVPVNSPYVDNTGRVRTQSLDMWSFPSSRLVEVVREVSALLVGAPADTTHLGSAFPQRDSIPARPPGYGPMQAAMGIATAIPTLPPHPGAGMQHSRPGSAQPGPPSPPPFAVATGWDALSPEEVAQSVAQELERHSVQELEELITDSDKFKQFAARVMSNTPAAQAVEALKAEVVEAAQVNLGRINEINEARNQLAIVRSSEYAVARAQYDDLAARQERVLNALAPEKFRGRLEDAVSKADHDSEELRAQFRSGSVAAEDFVEQFVQLRQEYYMLDMKRQFAEHVMPRS